MPDDEPVTVGRYGTQPSMVTAAQAVAAVRALADPRGCEVWVPRASTSAEIRRVRDVPQVVGWRYQSAAHGQRPCPCPGCLPRDGYKVARLRHRFTSVEPPKPKSELMAELRTATTADEIIAVPCELGRSRRLIAAGGFSGRGWVRTAGIGPPDRVVPVRVNGKALATPPLPRFMWYECSLEVP